MRRDERVDPTPDEAAAAVEEARMLRTLLDRLDVGVYSFEGGGAVRYMNPACARILGYPSVDAARRGSALLHYNDPKERLETFARIRETPLFKERGVARFEARRVRADDGQPVDVMLAVSITLDENGLPGQLDGTIDDIGDRKRAEKAFKTSEARFRIVFDEGAVGMVLTDPARRITRANDAFCRFVGRREGDLWGVDVLDLLHPDDRPPAGPDDGIAVPDGADRRFVRPDGQAVWGVASWSWIEVEPGEGRHGVVVVQDVTDRKRMEEHLQRAARLEALGVLAGGIAHDFNNILSAVLGNVSLASELPEASQRLRDVLATAEKATLRARELTRQIITFAKGGSPIKRVGPIGDVVRESADLCLRGTPTRAEIRVAPGVRLVEFDPGQMGQVFHNLFINALQAMPRGGLVRVEVEDLDVGPRSGLPLAPGPYVRIRVADEGVGIPPAILDRVFDPYFSTKADGSGLGLAIAHSVVHRHGGHIEVASTPGRGTVFTLCLPATQAPASAEPPAAPRLAAAARRARLLVMDDEPCVLEVAKALLESLGHRVDGVPDGDRAVEAYAAALGEGRRYDAVVLDLTVRGGAGGIEALEQLRALDPDVRAVVTSGYSASPVLSRYREHGFRGFLAKPFRLAELRTTLDEVLVPS